MKILNAIFLSLILSFAYSDLISQTVNAPDLRCLAVQTSGDVLITWIPPSDPGNNFVQYQLFGSGTGVGGPYNLITTIPNIGANSFLHVGPNAHTQNWSYYLVTDYNPGPVSSAPSDTLTTILLNVNNPGNGTAQLSWNGLSSPAPATFQPPYEIYRQVNGGPWNLAGTTTGLTYLDTITTCAGLVLYEIRANDMSGCISESAPDGDNFADQIGPGYTTIDSVSIDCISGDVVMGWQPNPAPDVYYYFMYKYDGGQSPPWVKTDSIPASQTSTSIPSGVSCGGLYSIAAFDSCGLSGLISAGHRAMCLNYSYIPCERKVTLSWNQYSGWPGGVGQYKVYYSKNSGPYQLAGTTGDTTMVISNLSSQDTYCYFVRAFASGASFTSSSNCICFFSQGPQMPAFHRLEYVTVLPDSSIDLMAIVDTAAAIIKYRIERQDGTTPGYITRDEIPMTQLTSPVLEWNDDSVEVAQKYYTYRVIAIDSCGLGADTSNLGRTILLEAFKNEYYWESEISWTPYIDWAYGVSHYEASHFADTGFVAEVFSTVPGPPLTATDNVEKFYTSDGLVCYYVTAYENFGDGILSESRSNTACIVREPLLFIPDAFTPGGLNPIFKPETSFLNYHYYTFQIYDRWGQVIFETDNLLEGWDGTVKGSADAPTGMYVYMVKWRSAGDQEFVKRGSVTLIRRK